MNKRGFTLIEIIAVIIILGILLIITVPLVQKYITGAGKASMAQTASAYLETVKAEYESNEYGPLLEEEEIMLIPIEYIEIEQGKTDRSKFAEYDKEKSYIYIVPENHKYEYYINLVDKAGNAIYLKRLIDLNKDNVETQSANIIRKWNEYSDGTENVYFEHNGKNFAWCTERDISDEYAEEAKNVKILCSNYKTN